MQNAEIVRLNEKLSASNEVEVKGREEIAWLSERLALANKKITDLQFDRELVDRDLAGAKDEIARLTVAGRQADQFGVSFEYALSWTDEQVIARDLDI